MLGAFQRVPLEGGAPPLAMLLLCGFTQSDAAQSATDRIGRGKVRLQRGVVGHGCNRALHSLEPLLLSRPSEPLCGVKP